MSIIIVGVGPAEFDGKRCEDHVCACFCVQTVTLYLVKWCSLPYEDSTWELKADIDQSKIEEYERIAARTPNTKRVASSSVCVQECSLVAVCLSLFPVGVCMCVFVCVGLLPAPSSSRFTAPLTALHRATFLWSYTFTRTHAHTHTPCSCGQAKPLTVCLMLNRSI